MEFLCAIPVISGLIAACAPAPPLAVGYVEGDYVLIAPIEMAEVRSLAVRRGDRVAAGQAIAALEDSDARFAVAEAGAALAQAEAQLANLKQGRRPEELAVLDAARQSAEAAKNEAERTFARIEDLNKRGIASRADLDAARTQVEVKAAALAQADANLAVAKLPARAEEIRASEQAVERARAAGDQAAWRLSKRSLAAPAAGRVTDVIRNPGDLAGPTAPILSLLPDGAVKLRLYVPETVLSSVALGATLAVQCDGCGEGLSAVVTYISPDPEFTPPVIYSLENRQKLVFLVEARPEGETTRLQPGQIVDARIAP
ncbi:MAG: HlyD family efflux transporter periplasmic adaptor subunit [Phyllobacteriaceae bacterium]|nr:HlyD family efflux transporter periplasmic adaptor subunit [Phyllobacteriaceae bacterium]